MIEDVRKEIQKYRNDFNFTVDEIKELDIGVMKKKLMTANLVLRYLTDKLVDANEKKAMAVAEVNAILAEMRYIKDFQKTVQNALRMSIA